MQSNIKSSTNDLRPKILSFTHSNLSFFYSMQNNYCFLETKKKRVIFKFMISDIFSFGRKVNYDTQVNGKEKLETINKFQLENLNGWKLQVRLPARISIKHKTPYSKFIFSNDYFKMGINKVINHDYKVSGYLKISKALSCLYQVNYNNFFHFAFGKKKEFSIISFFVRLAHMRFFLRNNVALFEQSAASLTQMYLMFPFNRFTFGFYSLHPLSEISHERRIRMVPFLKTKFRNYTFALEIPSFKRLYPKYIFKNSVFAVKATKRIKKFEVKPRLLIGRNKKELSLKLLPLNNVGVIEIGVHSNNKSNYGFSICTIVK